MTFSRALSTNNYGPAKFIVDGTTVANGTHSTIAAALTSASSGDTIFIRPGTYTENITLKVGVNLAAFVCDSDTPNVTISGTCTLTTAGTVSISGIRLQTNSAALLAVTGSAASIVNLRHCYLNCTNNDGITYSSSSGSSAVNIMDCKGNLGTTGIKLFAHSGAGTLTIDQTDINNSGGSSTASTVSAGVLFVRYSIISFPTTTSSAVGGGFFHCEISTAGQNVTAITHGATSVFGVMHCHITSGSASAVVINAATCNLISCIINSTNTNPVSGSGTVLASNITYEGTGIGISTTTINAATTRNGISISTKQPAFRAYNSAQDANVTGDGTVFTLDFDTEVFDQGNNFSADTFTAPYTGKYFLQVACNSSSLVAANNINLSTVTSNQTFAGNVLGGPARTSANTMIQSEAVFTEMEAADTCTWTFTCDSATKVTDVEGGANVTWCSGFLVC